MLHVHFTLALSSYLTHNINKSNKLNLYIVNNEIKLTQILTTHHTSITSYLFQGDHPVSLSVSRVPQPLHCVCLLSTTVMTKLNNRTKKEDIVKERENGTLCPANDLGLVSKD